MSPLFSQRKRLQAAATLTEEAPGVSLFGHERKEAASHLEFSRLVGVMRAPQALNYALVAIVFNQLGAWGLPYLQAVEEGQRKEDLREFRNNHDSTHSSSR